MGWFKANDPGIQAAIANGLIDPAALGQSVPPGTPAEVYDSWDHKEFDHRVKQVAVENGWLTYHTNNSRKSEAGYPDWTFVKDRVIWMELKVHPDKPSAAQEEWIEALQAAGQWVFVFYPEDFKTIVELLNQ
jgi:hypothetical protein